MVESIVFDARLDERIPCLENRERSKNMFDVV